MIAPTMLEAHRTFAAVTAFAALYAASWKACCICLKWLVHSSIAVPAAAAALPPFPDPRIPFTISPTALREPDLPVAFPAALIRLCDVMADRGAYAARAGRAFNAATLIAIPDDAKIDGAHDIALLAWATRLGYREGLEVGR